MGSLKGWSRVYPPVNGFDDRGLLLLNETLEYLLKKVYQLTTVYDPTSAGAVKTDAYLVPVGTVSPPPGTKTGALYYNSTDGMALIRNPDAMDTFHALGGFKNKSVQTAGTTTIAAAGDVNLTPAMALDPNTINNLLFGAQARRVTNTGGTAAKIWINNGSFMVGAGSGWAHIPAGYDGPLSLLGTWSASGGDPTRTIQLRGAFLAAPGGGDSLAVTDVNLVAYFMGTV